MSQVEERNDAASGLATWLGHLTVMYCKDLAASSDELLNTSPGGVARTPVDFTCEVIQMLHWTAGLVKGADAADFAEAEAMKELSSKLKTGPALIAALEEGSKVLADALLAAKPEDMGRMIQAPWGQPMPVMAMATIMVNHVWYHDGQLNYLQAIHGDSEVHWM